MDKKVLITGINGFTGKYVWQEFEKHGYDVYGFAQSSNLDVSSISSKIYACSLEQKDTLQQLITQIQPNIIVHLAAIAHVAHASLHNFYETNVIGTENLLNAIYQSGSNVQSVLLASSANIYGNNNSGNPLNEDITPHPENHYAISKLAMEQVAKWWSYKLPITIVRPFNYTGIGQSESFLIPKIVSHFKQNKKDIALGNIEVARDFSDVRVVAHYYRKLVEIEANKNGLHTYNVCSGKTHYLKEVIEIMQEITGYQINININPNFIRANEVKTLYGDNSKLINAVGEVEPISLQQTLSDMYTSKL
jgi:nucleoside-diphosphate-sugar epimerase